MYKKSKAVDQAILTGAIYPVLFSVSIPLILNNIIMSLYNLADGLWLAQLSMQEFTATSFVWPPHYLFVSVGVGLSIAGTAIIAQLLGQEDIKKAESYATHLFLLSFGLGLVLSVIGFILAPHIVRWMGAEGPLASKSTTYLSIILAGFFFELVYLSFNAIMGAQGKTKITTFISMVSSILNVVLDPLFIFDKDPLFGLPGLGLGIAGAAYATVISQAVKMLMGIWAIHSDNNEIRLRIKGVPLIKEQFWELIRTGAPTALGQSSAALGFTLLNAVIVAYGEATMSAYAAVNRLSGFLMMPAMGIGNAMTAIVGQNIGAGYKDRVKQFVRAAFIVATSSACVGGVLQYIFRYPMLGVFLTEGTSDLVWAEALEYNIYSALITPLMAFFSLFGGIFSGTGYHKYSAYISMGRLWVIRLPMIYLFQRFTNIGSTAVWIAMLASNVLIDIFGFWLYSKGKWINEPKLNH